MTEQRMSMIRGHKAGKSCGRNRREQKEREIAKQFINPIAHRDFQTGEGYNRIDEIRESEGIERVE